METKCHQWYLATAMDALLGTDFAVAEKNRLYLHGSRAGAQARSLSVAAPEVGRSVSSGIRSAAQHAPGLTPTALLEKLADIKMIDVWIPTVDQRWLLLPCYTQPAPDTKLLIEKLKLQLPSQPPPRLVAQKESSKIEVQTAR